MGVELGGGIRNRRAGKAGERLGCGEKGLYRVKLDHVKVRHPGCNMETPC